MLVNAQRHLIIVKIVDGVEVLEEEVADEVHAALLVLVQVRLVDHEEAGVVPGFLKVFFGVHLENVVRELEGDWFYFFYDILTRILHMAKCVLRLALNIRHVLLPLGLQLLEHLRRHCQLRGAGVDHGGVALVRDVRAVFAVVQHRLPEQGPGLEVRGVVFECLQSLIPVNNLRRIVSAKERVWRLLHVILSDAEADHGLGNEAVVFQGPEEVLFLQLFALLRREAENANELAGEALRFIE